MASTQAKQIWRTKHMQNIGPTASNLHQRKHRDNNICPNCEHTEDYLHLVRCHGPGTTEIFDRTLDDIQEWMKTFSTQSFRDTIEMLIRAVQDNTIPAFDDIVEEDLKAAQKNNGT